MEQEFVTKNDYLEAQYSNLIYRFEENYSEELYFALTFLFTLLVDDIMDEMDDEEKFKEFIENTTYMVLNSRKETEDDI